MNICAECIYFKKNAFDEVRHHECKHPDCRHPVSGRPQTCIDMRKRNAACGLAGALWAVGPVGQTVAR